MNKVLRLFLFLSLLCIAIFSFSGCIGIWYEFFDVTGLEFYEGQNIKEIYPYGNQLYLVTEDNKCYIAGGHSTTQNRKYRNTEFYEDKTLGIPKPVLFYEGGVKEIIPYTDFSALFVNDRGDLYHFKELDIIKIDSNVIAASRSSIKNPIYFVDNAGSFYSYDEGNKTFLCDNIKDVKTYREYVYVITAENCLKELKIDNDGIASLSDTILENVYSFEILDTSIRYEEGRGIVLDSIEGVETPLINVLLNDGSLYVKGCYNRWACPHYDPEDPIKYFETWTLIAEDVADYDTAVMGTIIKFNDGTAAYYGFDTIHYGKAEFSYKVLMSDKTSYIAATDNYVMLLREGKWYFWGSRFSVHFDDTSKDYYVLSGKPYILEVE